MRIVQPGITTFSGGSYMKKAMLLVFFVVLFPAAAGAGEKTLYEISEDALFLVESYAACADRDSSCSAEEAHAIKAGAQNGLLDLISLVKAGNRTHIVLTPDQAMALIVRARAVREQLVRIEIADEVCNAAIHFLVQFLTAVEYFLLSLVFWPILIGWLGLQQFIIDMFSFVIGGIWGLFLAIVLSPACLFWWL